MIKRERLWRLSLAVAAAGIGCSNNNNSYVREEDTTAKWKIVNYWTWMTQFLSQCLSWLS